MEHTKSLENGTLLKNLRIICTESFVLNIKSLIEYISCIKDILQNPVFVEEENKQANYDIVLECIRFIYAHFNPDAADLSVAKKSVSYEILFLLNCLKFKLICSESPTDEQVCFRIQCTVAGIAGKGALIWLITKEYGKANMYISNTLKMFDEKFNEEPAELRLSKEEKLYYESKRLSLLLLKIQIYFEQGYLNKAFEAVSIVKAQVIEFPTFENIFANLCFNVGLAARKENDHQMAILVLRQSFESRKRSSADPQKIHVVLKLLADSYLKYNCKDNWEKAIHALELAYCGKLDSFYLIKRLNATLVSDKENMIKDVLKLAINWNEIDMITLSKMIHMLMSNEKEELVLKFISDIKHKNLAFDATNLLPTELQIWVNEGNIGKAKLVVEYYLKLLEEPNDSSFTTLLQMLNIILPHASDALCNCEYHQSITLYQSCLDLLEKTLGVKEMELSELMCFVQRQICYCYIQLNNLEEAKATLVQLKVIKDDSAMTSYLSLKVAVLTDNEELANEAIYHLGTMQVVENADRKEKEEFETVDPVSTILSCCQDAYNLGKASFVIKILETYITLPISKCNKCLFIQNFQCLVQMYLECVGKGSEVYEKILMHMDKTLLVMKSIQEENAEKHDDTNSLIHEKALWFVKIFWNFASCDDTTSNLQFDLLSYCVNLLEVSYSIKCEPATLVHMKTCLLLDISVGLHLARFEPDAYVKSDLIKKILVLIEKCRNLDLKPIKSSLAGKMPYATLFIYEYEAKVLGDYPNLKDTFDKALTISELNSESFERIAALSHETGLMNYSITIKSLRTAIAKHLECSEPDFQKISKDYHSIIEVLFNVKEHIDPEVCEDIYVCCDEIIEIVQSKAGGKFPEIEVFWIMVKCWNAGIHCHIRERNMKAFRWCTLAVSFLNELVTLKSIHEKKITDLYRNLFSNAV